MAGSRNDTHYSSGYNLESTDAASIALMQQTSNTCQEINVSGSPEGVSNGNPGSLAHDRTSGNLWLKQTGTGNTGWVQIATGSAGYVSLAPFIVGATHSDFTTIQAGINAAVTAGASSSNQMYVLVKPGTYVENLVLHDGVHVQGVDLFFDSPDTFDFNLQTAIITGNHSAPAVGFCKIINCTLQVSAGYLFSYAQSTRVALVNSVPILNFDFVGPSFLASVSNSQIGKLYLDNSKVYDGGSNALIDNAGMGTGSTFTLNAYQSQILMNGETVLDHGTLEINLKGAKLIMDFTLTGTSDISFGITEQSVYHMTNFNNGFVALNANVINGDFSSIRARWDVTTAGFFQFVNCQNEGNAFVTAQPILQDCPLTCGYATINTPGAVDPTTIVTDNVIFADTTGPRTVTLFATPFAGMIQTVKDDTGTAGTNNITVVGNGNLIDGSATYVIDANWGSATFCYNDIDTQWRVLNTASSQVDLHTAKIIVGDVNKGANFSTLASGMAASVAGDTIFLQTGTYAENVTLKPDVNISAFGSDSSINGTGNVIIIGKLTMTGAGTCTIYGIQLETISDVFLAVTGSAASIVNLVNCYLNCIDNTGITYSSSNAASAINIIRCEGNLGTTGIAIFSHSSAGALAFRYTSFFNTGLSTTSNTASAGSLFSTYSIFSNPITTSGTNGFGTIHDSIFDCNILNSTAVTIGGSSGGSFFNCSFGGGSASAFIVTTTCNFNKCSVNSGNTNAISGAGTLNYQGLVLDGASKKISTTTQSDTGSGTFTPVLQFGGASTGITYAVQSGVYKRIDSLVYITVSIILTNKGSSTGTATIAGLPFASANIGTNLLMGIENLTLSVGFTLPIAVTVPTSSSLGLYQERTTLAGQNMADTNFANNSVVNVYGFYFV